MSASTSKKNRAAELEAGPSRKQLLAEKEAAAKIKSKRIRGVVSVLVAIVVVIVILFNTSFFYRNATAVTIGDEKYTPAELQYYLAAQYYSFVDQYGSYASIFGLNTDSGLAGLSTQPCPMLGEDGNWAQYFMNAGLTQLTQVKAMLDYAKENNITLDDTDIANIDANMDMLQSAADVNKVSLEKLIQYNYGGRLSSKMVRELMEQESLAGKAYEALMATFDKDDAELEAYYQGLNGASDTFTFSYYTVNAEAVETTDADGNTTSAPTDETKAAAKAKADAIAAAYKKLPTTVEAAEDASGAMVLVAEANAASVYTDNFNTAIASVIEGAKASGNQTSGANLNAAYADWLKGNLNRGDITVVENSDGNGYTVVLFTAHNDNHYKPVSVRHILVKAVADENGEYTDEAIETAYATALDVLKQWQSGEATEESFAALADENSEDEGSKGNGGLYESVTMDSTVPAFNAFCFGEHKSGDTAIVYGNNGSYAGFHVMYFVGENDKVYSNAIAQNAITSEETSNWLSEAVTALDPQVKFFAKLVA